MKTYQGIPKNVHKPIIGIISLSDAIPEIINKSIVINPSSKIQKKDTCRAFLFSNKKDFERAKNNDIPIIFCDNGIEDLSDGDVVEIMPDGKVIVLYQINSRHNIIFATSKCNSDCIMCPQPIDNNEGDLTDKNLELISFMDKSTEELAITGGEPTIIGKNLFRLILACGELLPNTSVLLLTNARKFSDFDYTHFFSSLRHPKMTIGIPLYGDNDIEHDFIVGSKGAFSETIRGILNLATFSHPIEIRTVIHKYTYEKMTRIADFIYRNMTFVKHIAIMGLETVGLARDNLSSLWVEPSEIVSPLEESVHFLIQRGMNVSIYNLPFCLMPNKLWRFARQSISDWKNSFDKKCFECSVKEKCSGMFESGMYIYGKYIKPIN